MAGGFIRREERLQNAAELGKSEKVWRKILPLTFHEINRAAELGKSEKVWRDAKSIIRQVGEWPQSSESQRRYGGSGGGEGVV